MLGLSVDTSTIDPKRPLGQAENKHTAETFNWAALARTACYMITRLVAKPFNL